MSGTFVCTLFSSSRGNCVYIRTDGGEYLVDAGVSARRLEASLSAVGSSLRNISAIFITHEHSDHTCGLETLSSRCRIPVYAPENCVPRMLDSAPHLEDCIKPFSHGSTLELSGASFTPFVTPHDSNDSCGYVIDAGDIQVGVATDMGHITKTVAEALNGCSAIIIESNHDPAMLEANPRYPFPLKRRISGAKGHLSNEACAAFLPYLIRGGAKSLVLAHLSPENNTPAIAYAESYKLLRDNGISVASDSVSPGDVRLSVAPMDGVCVLCDRCGVR